MFGLNIPRIFIASSSAAVTCYFFADYITDYASKAYNFLTFHPLINRAYLIKSYKNKEGQMFISIFKRSPQAEILTVQDTPEVKECIFNQLVDKGFCYANLKPNAAEFFDDMPSSCHDANWLKEAITYCTADA